MLSVEFVMISCWQIARCLRTQIGRVTNNPYSPMFLQWCELITQYSTSWLKPVALQKTIFSSHKTNSISIANKCFSTFDYSFSWKKMGKITHLSSPPLNLVLKEAALLWIYWAPTALTRWSLLSSVWNSDQCSQNLLNMRIMRSLNVPRLSRHCLRPRQLHRHLQRSA